VEPLGSVAEVKLLGNGHEISELAQLHVGFICTTYESGWRSVLDSLPSRWSTGALLHASS
jgi:hypothetical protein